MRVELEFVAETPEELFRYELRRTPSRPVSPFCRAMTRGDMAYFDSMLDHAILRLRPSMKPQHVERARKVFGRVATGMDFATTAHEVGISAPYASAIYHSCARLLAAVIFGSPKYARKACRCLSCAGEMPWRVERNAYATLVKALA